MYMDCIFIYWALLGMFFIMRIITASVTHKVHKTFEYSFNCCKLDRHHPIIHRFWGISILNFLSTTSEEIAFLFSPRGDDGALIP